MFHFLNKERTNIIRVTKQTIYFSDFMKSKHQLYRYEKCTYCMTLLYKQLSQFRYMELKFKRFRHH